MTCRVLPLLALSLLSSACARGGPEPIPIDPAEHARAVEAFAVARVAETAAPGSWLSLIGLHFLEPGETTVGSAPDNGIVLPAPAAPRLGTLVVEEAGVRWRTEAGVTVTQGVDSTLAAEPGTGAVPSSPSEDPGVEEADLTPGAGVGKSVVLRFGSLSWLVIRRGGRWALRVRDDASPAYQGFHGIERFPTSLDWRLTARWEPHEKSVGVPDVLGNVTEQPSPAALRFRVQGRDLALDVVGEPENGRYMLVFADATSGSETYGGGRFLWVDGPDEQGRVVVDFNFAFNPPCVWTEYATCPLPTRDNRLPVRVEAGEKSPKHAPEPSAAQPASTASPRLTPGAHLGDLSWPEAEARLRDSPLVIVPFGAGAKEHGPHLPMSTDRLMLEYLMQVAVDSLPVVVAPPLLHGWFPAFRDFPGTEISDPDVFRRSVEEVARSLVRHGARRIVFLNTGIANATGLPIAVAAREIHQREGVPTLVVSWGDLETEEVAALAEQKAGGHADELETSVVLALRPDLVHMELAPTDYGPPGGDRGPGYRPGGFSRTPGRPEYSTTGIVGDATLATAAKGRRVIAIMTREWIRALRAFATAPVGGAR